MRGFLVFILVLGGVCVGGSGAVYAQESQKEAPAADDPLADVPDEYIKEAIEYNQYCRQTPALSDYQNCECLAAKYLDKRIEKKDKITRSGIMLAIEGQCPDATQAAGRSYQTCMTDGAVMPPGIKLEDFCTCLANTYANLFEYYKPKPSSNTVVRLQTQAMVSCRDPALARRLYPDQIEPK